MNLENLAGLIYLIVIYIMYLVPFMVCYQWMIYIIIFHQLYYKLVNYYLFSKIIVIICDSMITLNVIVKFTWIIFSTWLTIQFLRIKYIYDDFFQL